MALHHRREHLFLVLLLLVVVDTVGCVQHSNRIRGVVEHDFDDIVVAVLAMVNDDVASASSPRPCRSVLESDCLLQDIVNPIRRGRLH